jgi:filamentous hemagglutinin family protein
MRRQQSRAARAPSPIAARHGVPSASRLIGRAVAAALLQGLIPPAHAAGHVPPLPTPCVGTPCGTNGGNVPFVTAGQASAVIAGQNLTVKQASNTAILNWRDFNIAAGYSVDFKQPSSTSSALNRIWSADPSTIAGKLTANGQIYLINTNGIIFAKTAQVDTGALIASALDINDQTFLKGLLSGNTAQYTNNGVLPPVFQAAAGTTPGNVTVEQGAQLQADKGGRVMLLGGNVTNAGTITTPDGQAILGAGNTVYLASTTDPNLRGLLIAVDSQNVAGVGTATNTGKVVAERGNVTLAGLAVNQSGTLSATTSVNANGSIYLVAGNADDTAGSFYNSGKVGFAQGQLLPTVGGSVTLGTGSTTQVTADSTSTGTITDAQSFYTSQVELVGKTIDVQSGAAIVAPGGQVSAVAFANPYNGVVNEAGHVLPPDSDGARIYVDSGAKIDVSGLQNVSAPASQNLVQIQLGANELQDDPLLRDGPLHGQTVTVDVNQGSPLLNQATLQAYAQTIGHTIDEKLTRAGSIALTSGGDVITRAGSTLNVSGGSIAYQNSPGSTSKLLGADGNVYDIGHAPTDIQYTGLADVYTYTDPRWGTVTTFHSSGVLAGYLQGGSAGSVAIKAPDMYLAGSMLAATTPGPYQRTAASLPQGGALLIGDPQAVQNPATQTRNLDAPAFTLLNSVQDTLGSFDPGSSLLPEQSSASLAAGALAANGFTQLSIASNGTISEPASTHLTFGGNGSIVLEGAAVDLAGSIRAPGSSVTVRTDIGLAGQTAVDASAIVLGPNAVIDVSGNWVNDSPLLNSSLSTAPTLFNGGSVSFNAAPQNDIDLGKGSLIDVSGGGWVSASSHLVPGAAGAITLKAGGPVLFGAATGEVAMDGTLRGASLSSGGTLSISSAWATVGAPSQKRPGEIAYAPDFFTQGGFANYNITGINGVDIGSADGTPVTIHPVEQSLVFTTPFGLIPTGTALGSVTSLQTLAPEYRKPASVSFSSTLSSFNAPGAGNLVMNAGASIVTDPGATVTLAARQDLSVFGTITAPAGSINLQLAPGVAAGSPSDVDGYLPNQALLVGSTARLSATGFAAVYTDNPLGLRTGQVLDGGSINVIAYKGSVVAQSGAVLDVSGTSATVDVQQQNHAPVPTLVAGAAGTIHIDALENLVLNSTLLGKAAAVPGAAGGTLSVGLDLFNLANATIYNSTFPLNPYPTADRNLVITSATGLSDHLPTDAQGNVVDGLGQVSSATLSAGGFDNIRLSSADIITLDGTPVLAPKATLELNALQLAATKGTQAKLSSAYVALGESNYDLPGQGESGRVYVPVLGDGVLTVKGDLIDVIGNSSVSGFQSVTLDSSSDIRLTYATGIDYATDFTGSLRSPADLTLRAQQIYPTTNAAFTINPADAGSDPTSAASYTYAPGAVTVQPVAGNAALPLSAQGSLTINTPTLNQYGALRAPFGQIALNGIGPASTVSLHAGSVTSVSGAGETVPYGSTQNGQQWTYLLTVPPGGTPSTETIDQLHPKQVSTSGADVVIDKNAHVDLSGGGDLYAYEFIAGTGGSKDVLTPGNGYSYAIVPSLGASFAPLDHQYAYGSNIGVGQQVYLSGIPGLAAGYYTLLPARYALLPGAFALQLVAPNSDVLPGSVVQEPGGSYLAAGRFAQAGTDIIDGRTSTFLVSPASVVRNQSQYVDSYANSFFTTAAATAGTLPVNLPADAGQLQLGASQNLTLQGDIGFAPGQWVSGKDSAGHDIIQTGAGGVASIVASQIEVVPEGTAADGALQLTADELNSLDAATLILGASRSAGATGSTLNVGATSVSIRNGAADPLQAPEIVLAALQGVDLQSGAVLKATGSSTSTVPVLYVAGDGALLRVANGNQPTVVRSGVPDAPTGQLSIAAGASVSGNSLILDAAGSTTVDPGASLSAHNVEASSSRISIGDVPAGTPGLNLTSQLLGSFSGLTDLSLRSSSSIDFYGTTALGSESKPGVPQLASITLDAQGIGGYGAGAKTIEAGTVTLANSGASATTTPYLSAPDGSGTLTLTALGSAASPAQIFLGTGDKQLQGFSGVALNAAGGDVRAQGAGALTLTNAGTLTLQAARVSTDDAAKQVIDNGTGAVRLVSAGTPATTLPAAGLGGTLSISGTAAAGADAVAVAGLLDLPGGNVLLDARGGGDLTVGAGTLTVAGVARPYYDTYAVAAGGNVVLSSAGGSVNVLQGAVIDVSGATAADGKTSGDAGALAVFVPQGQFALAGELRGAAANGAKGGDFTLDTAGNVDHSAPFSLAALNLTGDGFTGAIAIRDRGDGAVIVDGMSKASTFALSADSGTVTITGTVDTSGAAGRGGGDIAIWSRGDLTLASGALLDTSAGTSAGGASARAGNVTLGSAAGQVALQSGATIDLRGTAGTDNPGVNPDGRLTLAAAYDSGSASVRISPIGATLKTTQQATVLIDAQWQYQNVSVFGDSGDLTPATLASDVQAFAANAPAITAALTPADGSFAVQVRPSISILGPTDLTLASTLDMRTLASADNGVPVDLTLRAAGNLLLAGSLSDGFVAAQPGQPLTAWGLSGGDSGSFTLTAGADLAGVDPLATTRGTGNFILAPGSLVRTGNGNIQVAAGNSICLGCDSTGTVSSDPTAAQSVIYTAGVPSTNGPAFFTPPVVAAAYTTPAWPSGGGNVSLSAGGDIVSAPTTELVSAWLWRQGSVRTDGSVIRDTAWWLEWNTFQQGVGALGGGNVRIQAGGNVTDLSAVIPSNGRLGRAQAGDAFASAGTLVVNGGGTLDITAGGNVTGGLFEDDLGQASIRAGGIVGPSASTTFSPLLVQARSSFDVSAGAGITLDGVLNSTALPEAVINQRGIQAAGLGLNTYSYYFTYSPDSALRASTAGGDFTLNGNLTGLVSAAASGPYPLDSLGITATDFYPATLQAAALSGNLNVTGGSAVALFPAPLGNLTLLAQRSVNISQGVQISEVDPALAASPLIPTNNIGLDLALVPLPSVPLHQADAQPARIVAAQGDITSVGGALIIPKAADVVAGNDIVNLSYAGKNLNASDVTLIQAGGDIRYDTARNPETNQLVNNPNGIQVGGTGYLEAIAGGTIDLGDSSGLVTSGRLGDPRLGALGATLVVAAGLGHNADGSLRQPSYDAFITKYLTPGSSGTPSAYADDLVDYIASLNPGGTPPTQAQALAQFKLLSRSLQLPFISQVLTDELSATGLDHTQNGASYERGYTAINTLFPQKDAQGSAITYKGDIDLFFSQLKTEQGGDIDMLAPGGAIVVGVPNPPAELNDVKGQPLLLPPISAEANLGVLVLAQGAIQGFANNNFDVNQARMLTLQGGNIILWSSYGSIDAGKGAKTAQGAPPPVIETDPSGNVFVNPIGAVSGSGIGQLLTVQGIEPGLVNLIAPEGVVNAGEAGIRVAGNLNIAATAVLNVGNIKVGGTATGVPTSDAGALSGALSGANAVSDVSKQVVDQLNQNLNSANNFQQLTDSLAPNFIVVRMFCLGVQCEAQ